MQRRKYATDGHKHPVNVIHHEEATFGERLADGIASFIGSWRVFIIPTCPVAGLGRVNNLPAARPPPPDPLPYNPLHPCLSPPAPPPRPGLPPAGNRRPPK